MNNSFDNQNNQAQEDKPGVGWQILAFLFPIAGIIMYFNNRNDYPNKAKNYIQIAGIAMAIGIFFRLLGRM